MTPQPARFAEAGFCILGERDDDRRIHHSPHRHPDIWMALTVDRPMTRKERSTITIMITVAAIAFGIAGLASLAGCGHYEPPCSDCWKAL